MNTKDTLKYENDMETMFEELSKRYGCGAAQEIVDQIEKATNDSNAPDFMPVKACADTVELFRSEAQALLAKLKQHRQNKDKTPNILYIEERTLEAEFKRIYRVYWVSMKLFYPLYDRAMAQYTQKTRFSYNAPQNSTKMSIAA